MTNNDSLRYVAAVQEFGEPYVALYIDVKSQQLWLLVKLDSPLSDYAAIPVSFEDVSNYMNNKNTLSSLALKTPIFNVEFNNDIASFSDSTFSNVKEAIDDVDDFDSDYCDDEFWIKTFLNRIRLNRPFEVPVHKIS